MLPSYAGFQVRRPLLIEVPCQFHNCIPCRIRELPQLLIHKSLNMIPRPWDRVVSEDCSHTVLDEPQYTYASIVSQECLHRWVATVGLNVSEQLVNGSLSLDQARIVHGIPSNAWVAPSRRRWTFSSSVVAVSIAFAYSGLFNSRKKARASHPIGDRASFKCLATPTITESKNAAFSARFGFKCLIAQRCIDQELRIP